MSNNEDRQQRARALLQYFGQLPDPQPPANSDTPSRIRPLPAVGDTDANYVRSALHGEADKLRHSPEGQRNDTLNTAAFKMHTLLKLYGPVVPEDEVRDELIQAARDSGMDEGEILPTYNSGATAGQTKGARNPRPELPHNEAVNGHGLAWDTAPAPGHPDTGETEPDSAPNPLLADLYTTDTLDQIAEPRELVPGLLPLNATAWLHGPPGSKKTFIALSLAYAITTGQHWANPADVPEAGDVLYITGEGRSGFKHRIRALEQHYGTVMDGAYFLLAGVQLTSPTEIAALHNLITEHLDVQRLKLIVIDTQARSTVGMDENDNGAMGRYVQAVDMLRQLTGATVLTIHHSNKNGTGMRGATAIDGAADTILKATADGTRWVDLTTEKQKDLELRTPMRLEAVPVGDSLVVANTVDPRDGETRRQQIARYVQQFPKTGVTLAQLSKDLEVNRGTLLKLLNKMLRESTPRIRLEGRSTYFPTTESGETGIVGT